MALFLFQATLILTFASFVYCTWAAWNALSRVQRRQMERGKLLQQEVQK